MAPVRKPSWLASQTRRSDSAFDRASFNETSALTRSTQPEWRPLRWAAATATTLTVCKKEVMRADGRIEVNLRDILQVVVGHALPGPYPELCGDEADGCGRRCHEDVCSGCPGGPKDVGRAYDIDTAEPLVEDFVARRWVDEGGRMEHGKGLLGYRRWPGLGKGCLDRCRRSHVGLDKVTARGLHQHIAAVERLKVGDADALCWLATLEKLQHNIATHQA